MNKQVMVIAMYGLIFLLANVIFSLNPLLTDKLGGQILGMGGAVAMYFINKKLKLRKQTA